RGRGGARRHAGDAPRAPRHHRLGRLGAAGVRRGRPAEYTARIAIAHAALPARRRVIDISVPNARGMHVYPGDPVLRVESVRRIAQGDPCNLSLLTLGSHTGTHVDAPYHFLADGPRLGDVGLDRMIGEALVADLR